MMRTGRTGGGRADCGGQADRQTGWRTCGLESGGQVEGGGRGANGQTARGRADGRTDWQTGGRGRTGGGRVGGLADWRMGGRGQTGGRRISEDKTPNLTRHLTWPWEIQRGRPRVTVKLLDLPPSSR